MAAAIFFVGGIRSGKSGLAQRWAEALAPRRLYLATGQACDEEMTARIARHKAERGAGWQCLEEPLDPAAALASAPFSPSGVGCPGVLLLDCVSQWVANLMAGEMTETAVLERVDALAAAARAFPVPVGMVSVEAGLGMVAMSGLGRRFQDTLGQANQMLAQACHTVLFVSCGLPLVLKGRLPEELC